MYVPKSPTSRAMRTTRGASRKEATLAKLQVHHDYASETPVRQKHEPVELAQRAHTVDASHRDYPTTRKTSLTDEVSSLRTDCSVIEARRKSMILEAAKRKAEIDKSLIDQQLEADLAQLNIGSGSSRHSQRSREPSERSLPMNRNVEEWFENSKIINTGEFDAFKLRPCAAASACELKPLLPVNQLTAAEQLADAITNAIKVSSAKVHQPELLTRLATSKDLPLYSGDPFEWLQFKQSFYESSKLCKFTETENVWRLRKCLRGDAKDAVAFLLIGHTSPEAIINTLELRFGRPENIIAQILQQLKKMQPLPVAYHTEIVSFAIKIQNSVAAARAIKQEDYLRSPQLVDIVMTKLPNVLITKWADYAFDHQDISTSKLERLADFLMNEANKTAVAGISHIHSQVDAKRPEFRRGPSHTDLTISSEMCLFCKEGNHGITRCPRFKSAMRRDRWRFARLNRLCFKCLSTSHDKETCPAESCDIDGCAQPHHRLLHYIIKTNSDEQTDSRPVDPLPAEEESTLCETVTNMSLDTARVKVLLKVVPIRVQGPKGELLTHALLDDGATVTLIASEVAERVGLHGHSETVRVRSAWDSELVCKSETVDFDVFNSEGDRFELRARKINELDLPTQKYSAVNTECYEHLQEISELLPRSDVKPKLLIGQDHYHLLMPTDARIGEKNEPYATHTPLGWCVHGAVAATSCNAILSLSLACDNNTRGVGDSRVVQGETYTCLATAIEQEDSRDAHMDELVRRNFALEATGVRLKPRDNPEEVRAVAVLDKTAKLVDGRWEVGLPWKGEGKLPDSYRHAQRRLLSVERKMKENPEFGERYTQRVKHLFENDFARKVESQEDAARVWYLPHFGVDNPNKGKLRLVFDAAARSGGHSLNDYLLQGPDLLQSLLDIMLRFRERPVAVLGDIQDMFLRVRIRSEDQHALRFLWRGDICATTTTDSIDTGKDIQIFAMKSLIFGANCSPFVAQYVKNKNAKRFEQEMPEAVHAIQTSHYMDDYLDSFENKDVAIHVAHQVADVHMRGGFRMRNWTSNSHELIASMPKDTVNDKVSVGVGRDTVCERALGLLWFPESDTLGFDLSLKRVPKEVVGLERPPTKRETLGVVMSVFDVYGLLAPMMVKAKILLQRTWKAGITWDDSLPPCLFSIFRDWLTQLIGLRQLRIPRWYFQDTSAGMIQEENTTIELHIFTDASTCAYAAVAYWRKVNPDGKAAVSFTASRCRAAPVKAVSVPRMELQGALIGCRLADTLIEAHRMRVAKRYFWCDSMIVLHWIRNRGKSYKTYVANRLGEIDSLSEVEEWRYVPTNLNIADVATKENSFNLCADSEWFRGPAFLSKSPVEWPPALPVKEEQHINEEDLEQVNVVSASPYLPIPDPSRFSSWMRLLRSTANVLLFIEKLKKRLRSEVDCDLMNRAERLILQQSQGESFAEEINRLRDNKCIDRKSRLRKLTPTLDENGTLRVGGRINAAREISELMKHPIVLDGRSRVGQLIAQHYHVLAAHGNNEMVVNQLRQKYWLLGLRPAVRSVAAKCRFCRIRRAQPVQPLMGSLPEARVDHHMRPFTNTGVDLFGPMTVTVGRRHAKVYGVLFTCLTVRAVHIELVPTLSTDSFIMALRRMAARRGWPRRVFSDNGTNFRGADTELRKSFAEVQEEAVNRGVEWRFIPPGCPHMGGAWERLIRSVKSALNVVLKERAPREEVLATLMAEVENMVNSRPLTYVSVEPHTEEALTPNHFLLGSSSNLPVPGTFDDGDLHLRKQWRIAQRLTDMFWRRWVSEVLPVLIPRQKWTSETRTIKVGDLVVIADPSLSRGTWPKGVVTAVHPGRDGRVRVADVKTRAGLMRRPVTRLAVLIERDECRGNGTGRVTVSDTEGV